MSDFCPSDPLLEVSESDVQPSDTSESVRRPNYGVRVRPMSDKMGSDPSLNSIQNKQSKQQHISIFRFSEIDSSKSNLDLDL